MENTLNPIAIKQDLFLILIPMTESNTLRGYASYYSIKYGNKILEPLQKINIKLRKSNIINNDLINTILYDNCLGKFDSERDDQNIFLCISKSKVFKSQITLAENEISNSYTSMNYDLIYSIPEKSMTPFNDYDVSSMPEMINRIQKSIKLNKIIPNNFYKGQTLETVLRLTTKQFNTSFNELFKTCAYNKDTAKIIKDYLTIIVKYISHLLGDCFEIMNKLLTKKFDEVSNLNIPYADYAIIRAKFVEKTYLFCLNTAKARLGNHFDNVFANRGDIDNELVSRIMEKMLRYVINDARYLFIKFIRCKTVIKDSEIIDFNDRNILKYCADMSLDCAFVSMLKNNHNILKAMNSIKNICNERRNCLADVITDIFKLWDETLEKTNEIYVSHKNKNQEIIKQNISVLLSAPPSQPEIKPKMLFPSLEETAISRGIELKSISNPQLKNLFDSL